MDVIDLRRDRVKLSLPWRLRGASAVLCLAFAVGFVCFPQVAWTQSIKIMPFGDSATLGLFGKVGYRYPLWFLLQDAGFDVDFVGTQNVTEGSPEAEWYPEYFTTFDRDHQGSFALQFYELLPIAEEAAAAERPDVVLIMAGFSDVWYAGGGATGGARIYLPQIISAFREARPGVIILLSQVPPYIGRSGYPDESENRIYIEPLNEEIARIAQENNTAESPIYLIDNHTGFDTNLMFCCRDAVTPDPDGEAWIANNFFEVLEDVLPSIETDGFTVNTGLSDAWYNEDTAGQGLFVTVFEETGIVFLAWFTYDLERPPSDVTALLGEPGHRWLTAQGPYEGDTAQLEVFASKGGVFDSAQPAVGAPDQAGTMTIQWHDCNNATLTYDLDAAGTGVIPLTRVALDNVALCEALSGQ